MMAHFLGGAGYEITEADDDDDDETVEAEEAEAEGSLSDSANNDADSSALWERYKTALFYFLKRRGAAPGSDGFLGLQMVADPLEATWTSSPYDLSVFANKMSDWGDVYEPSATLRFTDQYERFLDNIRVDMAAGASPAAQNEKNQFEKDIHDLLMRLDDERFMCIDTWQRYKSLLNMDYGPAFERAYCPRIGNQEFELTRLRGMFEEIKTRVAGPQRDVMDAIANFAFDSTSHAWNEWNPLSTFLNEARNGRATSMSIEFNSRTDVKETRTWTKKKKKGFIFKKTKTETKEEVRFRSEHFNMRIDAAGFAGIRISPRGNWFDANVVNKYKSPSTWKNTSMRFFGQTGTLSLMPRTIFVVYKPKVTLFLSKEDGQYFMENKSSSFSFGPFASGKNSRMTVDKRSENNYEVQFETNIDAPYVIAVDYHIL